MSKIWRKIEGQLDKYLGGHITIGPITIYGLNAMHCAIEIWTKRYGYIVATPPLYWHGRWWPSHIFFSPNATPWAATFMLGKFDYSTKAEMVAAKWRQLYLGHNYDMDVDCRYIVNEIEKINRTFNQSEMSFDVGVKDEDF